MMNENEKCLFILSEQILNLCEFAMHILSLICRSVAVSKKMCFALIINLVNLNQIIFRFGSFLSFLYT